MADPAAFFSYVQADDQHDGGYLSDLRSRLAAEVHMQLGRDFVIFQDRQDILWGQRWQARIDRTIDGTTLLIAVLTPSFLKSEACRSEVERFLARERALGRDDLILPLYYVEASDLNDANDELAVELAARQYTDWRPLRFETFDQPSVRRALAALAQEIVQRLTAVTGALSVAVEPLPQDDDDRSPGFVELVAEAEEAMPLFTATIEEFGSQLTMLAEIVDNQTESLAAADRSSRPAAARLSLIRRLASELEDPVSTMEALAEDYVDQLARVDGGIGALTSQARVTSDPDEMRAAKELSENLHELARQSAEGLDALSGFGTIVRETGRLSATIRPVFRRISRVVDTIISSKGTFQRWANELGEVTASYGA